MQDCSGNLFEMLEYSVNFGGLKMTYDIVEKFFVKGLFVDNLEKYNLKYDDNIYYMFHSNAIEIKVGSGKKKKEGFCGEYVGKMLCDDKMALLIKFREMFSRDDIEIDEIKKYMGQHSLVPDQYCYEKILLMGADDDSYSNYENEYSVENGKVVDNAPISRIINWLENDYGFKPTVIVLKYFEENYFRLFDKYFASDKDAHHASNSDWKKLFVV